MRIAICARLEDADALLELLHTVAPCARVDTFCEQTSFDHGLRVCAYDVIFVSRQCAAGVEAVRLARDCGHDIPLIWMTGDPNFREMSNLSHKSMALVKPVDREQVIRILSNCKKWIKPRNNFDMHKRSDRFPL